MAETLRSSGYNTAAFGKWHNTPNAEQSGIGPFTRWPTSLGFEKFYGFLGPDSNQWSPSLVDGTNFVDQPDRENYHLTEDLVDKAIDWLHLQQVASPHKPFFLYFAPGACHAPHHAPTEWIRRYEGRFDHGWDEERERTFRRQRALGVIPDSAQLTPRPPEIPAWDELTLEEQRVAARLQEAFCGFLSHTDDQIARLLDAVDVLGVRDNTMIIYIVGDNGPAGDTGTRGTLNEYAYLNRVTATSREMVNRIDEIGGHTAFNAVPVGWSWAGATPFQWLKQVASHYGATRNPLVMSWPKSISAEGELRQQFHHVVDIVPTMLEAAGVAVPKAVNGVVQRPLDGVPMGYSFETDGPSTRQRQYFEIWGHRALYDNGWLAGARHARLPWLFDDEVDLDVDSVPWELYHVAHDFSQAHDLAAAHPKKLKMLQELWWAEAGRAQVLPLESRLLGASKGTRGLPPRKRFTYFRPVKRLPIWVAPNLSNRSHRISAVISGHEAPEGVLVNLGGRFGGYALMILDGRLVYAYNLLDHERSVVATTDRVPTGVVSVAMEFTVDSRLPGSGGSIQLAIDGMVAGEGRIERTVPYSFPADSTFNVGRAFGTPVIEDYTVPFPLNATLERLDVEILGTSPDVRSDEARVLRAIE